MYFVVVTDHIKQLNNVVYKTVYVDDAAQICEEEAIDVVLRKEGENYFKNLKANMSLRKRQKFLPVGYSVVKSKSHLPKYTVFNKEPNGIILHGSIKKLFTFFVVKYPAKIEYERISEMDIDERCYFNSVLDELKKKKPEVD